MKKFLITICLMFLLAGCNDDEPSENSSDTITNSIMKIFKREEIVSDMETTEQPKIYDKKMTITEDKAQKIANAVSKIEDINKVSVIINSESVLIGIETKGELTDDKLVQLKNDVETEVRLLYKDINRVSVTASKELVGRINKMADFVVDAPDEESTPKLTKEQKDVVQKLTPPV